MPLNKIDDICILGNIDTQTARNKAYDCLFIVCAQQWNETYLHYHKTDPKQVYYLSMEYLQGRALTNAVGNLNIQDAYADALNKLGHDLEEVAQQVKYIDFSSFNSMLIRCYDAIN